jgi:CRISPR-associated endonuclease Csy4
MDHYLHIRLRPDPEFSEAMLMSALFSKLHRGLVTLEANDIGVSFPEHRERPKSLGSVLRVFGSSERLQQLMALDWLSGMRDHVSIREIASVPPDAQHRVVRRVQFKTSAERLRRRHIRRHEVSEQTARQRIPDSVERSAPLPFANIRSLSTGQTFSLFIEHGPLRCEPADGEFNRYGLSTTATVPWF